jgi:tRNA(adenine34) deaminase
MYEERFMRRALVLAGEAGKRGEVPVGCVITRGGEIVGEGSNRREEGYAAGHAEMEAITAANRRLSAWRLSDCELYVTLEPCPMCAGAMVMSRVGKCVYGAPDPEKGCCGSVYDLPADPALGSTGTWEQAGDPEVYRELLQACFRKRRTEK